MLELHAPNRAGVVKLVDTLVLGTSGASRNNGMVRPFKTVFDGDMTGCEIDQHRRNAEWGQTFWSALNQSL